MHWALLRCYKMLYSCWGAATPASTYELKKNQRTHNAIHWVSQAVRTECLAAVGLFAVAYGTAPMFWQMLLCHEIRGLESYHRSRGQRHWEKQKETEKGTER